VLIEDGPLVTLNGLTSNTTGNTETVLQSNPPVEIGMPTEHKREQLKPLDQVVSDHIIKVLDTTNGRIEGTQGASAILDINPSTLRSKMRKLNISWEKKDDST
jgi:transcriptional regulator of acetoin/glycerol metabolism